jgi:hypothetical protein
MARTKENLRSTGEVYVGTAMVSFKQWLREKQTLNSIDGGGACITEEVG